MTQEEFFKRYSYTPSKDRIGGGSFGTVYKAYDNLLHRELAIKVSEVKTTADGKKTFSLKDEFEALSHVPKHPNIANYEELYSFEMPNGIFDYAVMQYYPDGNLSNAIKQGLTAEQKEDIATQLLEGIGFLHKHKVAHRDLKPGNILIVKHGGRIIPLITDFGLSKATGMVDGSVFSNSFGAGTPRYSSPEQLQGNPLRLNTDLWSYGAILYELFTGQQLFSAGSGAANTAQADLEIYNKIVNGDVRSLKGMPETWRKVAERCLVVDPTKRAKDATELFAIVEDDETEVGDTGGGTPPPEPEPNPNPKKGLWIGLGIAALVALLSLLLWPKKPQPIDPDTQAFEACQTVDDYRVYMHDYGDSALHYADAQAFVARWVADSIEQARQAQALADAAQKEEAERQAQAKAEKKEDDAYRKCTNIAACDSYLQAYPNGRYVEEVKAIKIKLEPSISYNSSSNSFICSINGTAFVMKCVEGGTFQMGATSEQSDATPMSELWQGGEIVWTDLDDEKPVHSVTVGTFYIGETEVTQALWKAVMGNNPSRFKGDKRPVDGVSWNDCQKFIQKLNQLTGENFRLPTEAEWEFAARGGNQSKGFRFAGSNTTDNLGVNNYHTNPVKSELPNELGLYDMSGNVEEWCSDWYDGEYYSKSPSVNPQGPSYGELRVMRGGHWNSNLDHCRVSCRTGEKPDIGYEYHGFRLAITAFVRKNY